MKKGEQQILRFLLTKNGWVTANLIAANVGCSVRSVKSRIADINAQNPNLILSSRSGYQIGNRSLASSLLENRVESAPQDADERKIWLIRKLLIENQHISMERLADDLCISYQTLEKLLNSLKPRLATYELHYKTKNDIVYISGSENNKRNMLIDLIYDEMADALPDTTVIQSFLPNVSTVVVREIINSTLADHSYYLDEYSLVNLSMLLALCIEREMACPSHEEYVESETLRSLPAHLRSMVNCIVDEVSTYYGVTLTSADLGDLALLFSTRASSEKNKVISASSPQLDALIEKIRERLKYVFGLELDENENMVRFTVHLHNMLIRLQNNVRLKNPDWVSFKRGYPYIYEIAVVVAEVVANDLGCDVPDDEIGYLGMYLYIFLAQQKGLEQKVRAILVCPDYSGQQTALARRLSSIFTEELLLVDVVSSSEDIASTMKYDFIISTNQLSLPEASVVVISTHPSAREMILIEEEVVRQRLLHMQRIFGEQLSLLFMDDFYFYSPACSSKEEVINFLCEKLMAADYVESDFAESVYSREKVCSSAMGNIALPHPMKPVSKRSAIAVAVFPDAIAWDNSTHVNLVLLLSICPDEMQLFQDIYSFVSEFISNNENLQPILKAKSSKEFTSLVEKYFLSKLNN